jgi:uncharacterized protein (TIGR03437 family)
MQINVVIDAAAASGALPLVVQVGSKASLAETVNVQ